VDDGRYVWEETLVLGVSADVREAGWVNQGLGSVMRRGGDVVEHEIVIGSGYVVLYLWSRWIVGFHVPFGYSHSYS
jgi:hypothetical protein